MALRAAPFHFDSSHLNSGLCAFCHEPLVNTLATSMDLNELRHIPLMNVQYDGHLYTFHAKCWTAFEVTQALKGQRLK